jgi:outer membrane protein TolC
MIVCRRFVGLVVCALVASGVARSAHAQGIRGIVFPEQRRMEIRDPSRLPKARLPDVPTPPTVSEPGPDREPLLLSLDDVIGTALENSEVVRVLTGAGATSSGSTIYDPAITNTQIDQARARFDPSLQLQNDFDRTETPGAVDFRQNPADPPDVRIEGDRIGQYNMGLGLSKTTTTGGTASLGVRTNPLRSTAQGLPLNPQTRSSVDLSFSQPLLQGAGRGANLAPIELARIDTERSFYQLKDSVQQLVRGVIEAYWALVFARVDVWAREQQVKQGEEDFVRIKAEEKVGRADGIDVAQVESATAGFEARLVTAKANLLRREAALRNILGLPPSDPRRIIPVTPPSQDWIDVDWQTVLRTAEQYRPDLIERKLLLEADRQELLLARNQALPRVDARALYRWDALEGRTPDRTWMASGPGQFPGWQFGLDVSVPLGLRQSRAALRQRELLLMRDRANLEQALHNATHLLAENYRNLAQYYQEYQAFTKTRDAALINLMGQSAIWKRGLGVIYLNVLQARTSWGDAVDAEAQSLLQYNTELANLQQQMGTILEAHGIGFLEERYCSTGPTGRLFAGRWYPKDRRPGPNQEQYERTSEPAEHAFDLEEPVIPRPRDLGKPLPPIRRPDLPPEPLRQPLPEMDRHPFP